MDALVTGGDEMDSVNVASGFREFYPFALPTEGHWYLVTLPGERGPAWTQRPVWSPGTCFAFQAGERTLTRPSVGRLYMKP